MKSQGLQKKKKFSFLKIQFLESIGTRFLFGGLSCMVAATITNPVDVTKIRLQVLEDFSHFFQ